MRLLSFVSEIERSLAASAPGSDGGWVTRRTLNFHLGLARLTIKPRAESGLGGTLFVQAFTLADGSLCLKASLGWEGSDEVPVMAVYSSPTLNGKREAARIAAAWIKGPSGQVMSASQDDLRRLAKTG